MLSHPYPPLVLGEGSSPGGVLLRMLDKRWSLCWVLWETLCWLNGKDLSFFLSFFFAEARRQGVLVVCGRLFRSEAKLLPLSCFSPSKGRVFVTGVLEMIGVFFARGWFVVFFLFFRVGFAWWRKS